MTGGSTESRPGEGYVSIHLNTPVEPEGFEGSQARISYVVWDDPAAARAHLRELEVSAQMWAQRAPSGRGRGRIEMGAAYLSIAEDNVCHLVNDHIHYCQIVVGRVIIDIGSWLERLGLSNDAYFEELARAALAHLRKTVPGVD